MNREEALAFLLAHQPMASDRELNKATIEKYDEVRRFFTTNPDVACVRPFLGSFGEGDGLGVYQLMGDVFRKLPRKDVTRALVESLSSAHRSVRYWSAQLAAEFPSAEFVAPLVRLLREDDRDLKYAALTALEQSGDSTAIPDLEDFLNAERDDELRELAEEIAASLQAK